MEKKVLHFLSLVDGWPCSWTLSRQGSGDNYPLECPEKSGAWPVRSISMWCSFRTEGSDPRCWRIGGSGSASRPDVSGWNAATSSSRFRLEQIVFVYHNMERYVSGHSRPFFVTTDSIQMFYLKVGRILVSNLWCRKRQLYQLSQNHCPKCKKVGIQFYSCCRYIWFSRYLKAIKCLRCVNECRRCSRSQQWGQIV